MREPCRCWVNRTEPKSLIPFDSDGEFVFLGRRTGLDLNIPGAHDGLRPDQVDIEQVQELIPHGKGSISVVHGGLDVPQPNQAGTTTVANVAVVVYLDLEPGDR